VCCLLGNSDRRCRFDDDEVAAFEHRGDRAERGGDGGRVSAKIGGDRGRHRDDEGICRLGGRHRAQSSRGDRGAQNDIEVRLSDVRTPRVDARDRRLIDVDADYIEAARRKGCCGWEPDISEAEDTDGLNLFFHCNRSCTIRWLALPSPNGLAPADIAA
jgi:hypothetical protein